MKTATITHRHLAWAALVLLLGLVAILAPVAAADHGHKGGHGKKPEFLSCKPLLDFGSAIKQVADDTGTAPDMGQSFFYRLPVGKGSLFHHVPTTECYRQWGDDDMGNSTAFGNCGGCTEGEWESCAAIGVSEHEFKQTIPHPLEGDSGGYCASVSGPGYTVKKYSPPRKGSQGYVVAHVTGSDPQGPNPIDYSAYAWTKGGGCFVGFDAWPLTRAETEGFVNKAVRSLPKSKC